MGKHSGHKNESVIEVGENLTIEVVSDLKARILDALNASENVSLNLECIENIDIAGTQLLCSANKSFIKQKKTLDIRIGGKSDLLNSFRIESGYGSDGSCPEGACKTCLWKGDGEHDGKENTHS